MAVAALTLAAFGARVDAQGPGGQTGRGESINQSTAASSRRAGAVADVAASLPSNPAPSS